MKKKKTVLIILSIILLTPLLFASRKKTISRDHRVLEFSFQYKNEKFSFDFMPVSEFTYEEVAKLPYQLPNSLLSSLSTEELIWFCADHPIFVLPQYFMEADILENFNGFRKLITRDNLWDELFKLRNTFLAQGIGYRDDLMLSANPYAQMRKQFSNIPLKLSDDAMLTSQNDKSNRQDIDDETIESIIQFIDKNSRYPSIVVHDDKIYYKKSITT